MWQMVRSGGLGRLVQAYDRHCVFRKSTSWTDPARRDRWRLDQAASGGRMQEFGSHKVNWLVAVGGRVKSVIGRRDSVASALAERGVDDVNLLLADFEAGGVGSVEITMTPTTWNRWTAGIVGTEASVEWSGGGVLTLRRADADETEAIPLEPAPETRQEHFFRWIREIGDPQACPTPEVSAEGAYHVLEICLRFLESARERKVIELRSDVR
jgi:predicted dehydrogenase